MQLYKMIYKCYNDIPSQGNETKLRANNATIPNNKFAIECDATRRLHVTKEIMSFMQGRR